LIRIGLTYLYVIFRCGYPHSMKDVLRVLPDIRRLGFRFLETEGLGRDHMDAVYRSREEFHRALDDCGLHVHNFCVVNPELVSLDRSTRRRALDSFRKGAEVASVLGAETLHLASYAPPVEYRGRRPYSLGAKGGYAFADRTRVRIPSGFDWRRVWRALVASCQACADIGARHGKTVLMEPRVGEVICSPDSLLRLIEHVERPNFKANFDTGHFSAQREDVVLALAKLRGHFANIHISDNDPVDTEHLPIGEGSIDWPEFFRVLKTMRWSGYMGLDLGAGKSPVKTYRKSVERLGALARRAGLPIEV
jgi:sugar phosphate isomerase/epimerase